MGRGVYYYIPILELTGRTFGESRKEKIFVNLKSTTLLNDIQFSSVHFSRSVVSDSLRPRGLCRPWNSPGQNAGVGSLSLL